MESRTENTLMFKEPETRNTKPETPKRHGFLRMIAKHTSMEDNPKNKQDNAAQTPAQQQADEIHRENPGLKDERANNDKNEGANNEEEVIEETSEDRLSEAE